MSLKHTLIGLLLAGMASCANSDETRNDDCRKLETISMVSNSTNHLAGSNFARGPLRNGIGLEMNAPVSEIWTLMGHLSRFDEFSRGIQSIEVISNSKGASNVCICQFMPREQNSASVSGRSVICWYEPNRRRISVDEHLDSFGILLTN
jgi:hypothetical protein